MLKFLFRRLLAAIPVVFAVMAVTFGLSQALPGGPFDAVNQRSMPEHIKRQLEQRYGLNKPVFFNTPSDGSEPDTAWGRQLTVKAGYDVTPQLDENGEPLMNDDEEFIMTQQLYAVDENGEFVLDEDGQLVVDREDGRPIYLHNAESGYVVQTEFDELDDTGFSVYRKYDLYRWDNVLQEYITYVEQPYNSWAKENNSLAIDIANTSNVLAMSLSGLPNTTLHVNAQYSGAPAMSYSVNTLEDYVQDCQLYGNLPGWSVISRRDKCKTVGGSGTGEDSRIFTEKVTSWQIDMLDTQFWGYMWNVFRLDFGPSLNIAKINENVMVMDEIEDRLPVSMQVGIFSVAFGFLFGVPLGVTAALYHNKPIDYVATFFAVLGQSIPNMVLGPILIIVFAVQLDWLPEPNKLIWIEGTFISRMGDPEFLAALIMPVIALGTGMSAGIARLTRASLLQVMREDYIRTARAKGLRERTVIYLHALKNSLIPVATILGPLLAGILTGTFIVELIFLIPGLGDAFITSVAARDYTTIMAVTILYSSFLIAGNILVDIIYTWLDPRIRFD